MLLGERLVNHDGHSVKHTNMTDCWTGCFIVPLAIELICCAGMCFGCVWDTIEQCYQDYRRNRAQRCKNDGLGETKVASIDG